ncbi:DinB family protein [Paludibaculum fermentans]|uniref:DinB family protein n=1 Tax=Paludibaculum fermentans TaxID=1473598 RepID=A0A7S7NWK7_PALFE|nr:DinB family protein [Paludibaculum fermentans]QOY91107.1 DinB family protein [Paludibaculum fermentans]
MTSRRGFSLALLAAPAAAQSDSATSEYLGEFGYTAQHTIDLAKAFPAGKFGWRPAPGVRSTGEVFVHLAAGNLMLLGKAAAPGSWPDVKEIQGWEKTKAAKDQTVDLLVRSKSAVEKAYAESGAAGLSTKVDFFGKPATANAIYLRILAHTNEHLGQMIAYARISGVTPPWSKSE